VSGAQAWPGAPRRAPGHAAGGDGPRQASSLGPPNWASRCAAPWR